MNLKLTLGLALISSLVGLAHARVVRSPASSAPMNLSAETAQLRDDDDNGRYMAEIAHRDSRAEKFLARHSCGRQLALVVDIDATALANWPEMAAEDLGHFPDAPCSAVRGRPNSPYGALAWGRREKAAAIRPALALLNFAQAHGVTVLFIIGRHAAERVVTTENLIKAGYGGWNPKNLLMESNGMHVSSATDFKAPERTGIEEKRGYTIAVNAGDQWSDLAGGYSQGEFKRPIPFYHVA